MKNIKFLSLFVFFFTLSAQDLDQAYLNSLPEDIRKDVLDRAEQNEEESKEKYRASIYSSRLEEKEELEMLKQRLEADLSELERRLSSDENINIDKKLKLFGADFFSSFQTSFMPINEPNLDPSYILDVGDVLKVQLIGQKDLTDIFPISRDGTINLPEIGKINLAGLTLNKAYDLISSQVNKVYIGTSSYVNLDQIRDINILVSGNAKNPGLYTLTGNSNILHAIDIAGGINEYGSFRAINLIRDNEVIEVLDVYDLLLNGNYNINKRLRSGDVIFVEQRKNIVSINGAVKRPAKYELKANESLGTIFNFANGLKQTADLENIYLERVLDGSLKSIPIVNKSQFDLIKAIDGDLVYIREYPFRSATISGAVYKPGTYTMAAGETVDDLLIKAGGFTDNAYPFGAVYENNDAKLINKKAKEVLYNEFLDNIIAMSQQNISENFDLAPVLGLFKEIKDAKPNGRIIVDLINEDESSFLNISEGDSILIPELTNNVYVYGEVSTEGAVMYSPGRNVDYFVNKSGGYKKFADKKSIYILHPNGETDRYSKNRNLFANQPNADIKIYPGSVIFIPRELDNTATRRLAAQAYVSILGNIGVALASLSSINNN
jgi:protein involved in polysaccharide export with SLBB domain